MKRPQYCRFTLISSNRFVNNHSNIESHTLFLLCQVLSRVSTESNYYKVMFLPLSGTVTPRNDDTEFAISSLGTISTFSKHKVTNAANSKLAASSKTIDGARQFEFHF